MCTLSLAIPTARRLQFTLAPLLALALTFTPGCDGDDGATSGGETDAGAKRRPDCRSDGVRASVSQRET